MENIEFLDRYEEGIMQHLLQMLTSSGHLDGQLLETADISEKWDVMAPAYIHDAVGEIAEYPTVALGWAMYLGMAVAAYWDKDWEYYSLLPNIYETLRDRRGFDCMDEAIREEVLGLQGKEFVSCEQLVQACAQQVLDKIRHEQISPQSPLAFHIFVRSVHTLYLIGTAVELKRMGYKFEKVEQ